MWKDGEVVVTFANAEGYASIINGDDDAKVIISLAFHFTPFLPICLSISIPKNPCSIACYAMLLVTSSVPVLIFSSLESPKKDSTQPRALLVELVHMPSDPCV